MNGWSGGQYSVYRVLLGVALAVWFARSLPLALLAVAIPAALLFAIGWLDRTAAVVMLGVMAWVCLSTRHVDPLSAIVAFLLIAHLLLPAAPFGSWSARKRVDPRGGWRMPAPIYVASWMALIATYLCLIIGIVSLRDVLFGLVVLHFFAFDPRWIRALDPETTDSVFYDGSCGLCHRSVRFLLAEDRSGRAFRFAPLQGDTFAAMISDRAAVPDSLVVRKSDGTILLRSDGIIRLQRRLGGLWRTGGELLALVPRPLRDAAYDFVARIRYRLFGREKDACPLMPPDLRARFDA